MKPTRSPWGPLAAALFIAGSLGAGAIVRDRLEVGVPGGSPSEAANQALFASLDTSPPIPESDYFYRISELLKEVYVDPVKDDQKLAIGAIRGMVGSLADPLATFMNPEQYKAFLATQSGRFEGAGVEVKFQYNAAELEKFRKNQRDVDPANLVPDVLVSAVVPGGPADKAGIKTGDRIESVNGKWVLSTAKILELRTLNREYRTSKADPETLAVKLKELQDKAKNGIPPARARDLVTLGTSGEIKLAWVRGKQPMTAVVAKRTSVLPALTKLPSGDLALRLFSDAPQQLKGALAGKSSVRIDLRNSTLGNFAVLGPVMEQLAVKGAYGVVATEKGETPMPLKVEQGTTAKKQITFVVDKSTSGAAEVLALALASKGAAKLSGEGTAGERAILSVTGLPDGSGYTLPTGRWLAAPKGGKS